MRRADLPGGPVEIDSGTVELRADPDRPSGVTVFVNGDESSYLDLAEPDHLEFEYMQHMVAVIDQVRPPGTPLRALHLGAAACALPRALDAMRPGSRQVAVEIDRALAAYARLWFDLPRSPRLRLRVGDARYVAATVRPGSQDVVVRDVFSGSDVPPHVRTQEFAALVRDLLGPDGVYLVNCTDEPPLRVARAEAATATAVFAHVMVISEPAILRGRRYGNVVLACSNAPLPTPEVARTLRGLPYPATVVAGDDLARFCSGVPPLRDPAAPAPA